MSVNYAIDVVAEAESKGLLDPYFVALYRYIARKRFRTLQSFSDEVPDTYLPSSLSTLVRHNKYLEISYTRHRVLQAVNLETDMPANGIEAIGRYAKLHGGETYTYNTPLHLKLTLLLASIGDLNTDGSHQSKKIDGLRGIAKLAATEFDEFRRFVESEGAILPRYDFSQQRWSPENPVPFWSEWDLDMFVVREEMIRIQRFEKFLEEVVAAKRSQISESEFSYWIRLDYLVYETSDRLDKLYGRLWKPLRTEFRRESRRVKKMYRELCHAMNKAEWKQGVSRESLRVNWRRRWSERIVDLTDITPEIQPSHDTRRRSKP